MEQVGELVAELKESFMKHCFIFNQQSPRDDDLKVLGRDHNSQHALQTVAEARRLFPGRVSVDVMFGRPGQSVASWELELDELLSVCDDHVSLYQLTLERGMSFLTDTESFCTWVFRS